MSYTTKETRANRPTKQAATSSHGRGDPPPYGTGLRTDPTTTRSTCSSQTREDCPRERRSGGRSSTSSTPTSSSRTRSDARARADSWARLDAGARLDARARPEVRTRPHGRSRSNTSAGDKKVLSSSPTRPRGRRDAQPMSWASFMLSADGGEGTVGQSTTTTNSNTGRRRDEKEHSLLSKRSGQEQEERSLPSGENERRQIPLGAVAAATGTRCGVDPVMYGMSPGTELTPPLQQFLEHLPRGTRLTHQQQHVLIELQEIIRASSGEHQPQLPRLSERQPQWCPGDTCFEKETKKPPLETALAIRKTTLTTSFGPGPATYVSIAHGVEFELEDGSTEEELALEIYITQDLAFVECRAEEGSRRVPAYEDGSTEEFLAMTFVHGPEGVTFSDEKPAKLRFFLGCVDNLAPAEDGVNQVAIPDEEIERDVLEAYRPLTSPDGVNSWTTHGSYSVIFRRVLGEREVWVETPVYHFSVKSNAKKIDKAAKGQSYYYGDLGGRRWGFKGPSSVPIVRFGNNTKEPWAIFTQYRIVQHTEASSEREVTAEIGAFEATVGGGVRQQSSAVGSALPSAGEKIMTMVKSGTYEDCEVSCDVKKHLQMHVRVGVLQDLTRIRLRLRGKLQLLDAKKISGNKVLVLRQPRLEVPTVYDEIDWPCSAEAICNIQVRRLLSPRRQ